MKKHIGKLTFDFNSERLRRYGPYILAGLVTLLTVSLYLDNHRMLATWELGIQDTMVSLGHKPAPPSDVVVVTIDDNAVKKLGAWPWNASRWRSDLISKSPRRPRTIRWDRVSSPT